jgi:hypothetical protein
MTIPSEFPDWLRVAERDGRGGASAEPPAIRRGEANIIRVNLAAHPVYGDWTEGAFSAVNRASPGADGDALAEWTCTIGAPAGGLTPVILSLGDNAQSDLPPIDPETGIAETFFALRFTPTGGAIETLVLTRQLITGAV